MIFFSKLYMPVGPVASLIGSWPTTEKITEVGMGGLLFTHGRRRPGEGFECVQAAREAERSWRRDIPHLMNFTWIDNEVFVQKSFEQVGKLMKDVSSDGKQNYKEFKMLPHS